MNDYIFINKDIEILEGERAKEMLKNKSDSQFFQLGKGVINVTKDRWEEAQKAEYTQWFKNGKNSKDDRNYEHLARFDSFASIASLSFENAIELGCGPFTNIGIIINYVNVEKITLLDPLIYDYLNHPNVTYTQFEILKREIPNKKPKTFNVKRIQELIWKNNYEKKVPLSNLYSCSIEEFETKDRYDLVILINVLEHCFNTELIFNKVLSLLRPGGIFIFHDKYYKQGYVEDNLHFHYDSAHPLKIEENIIEEFLNENFHLIYKRIDEDNQTWGNMNKYRQLIYFIGRRISIDH